MLRRAVLALGCILLAAGIIVILAGRNPGGIILLVNGLLLTLGVLFERYRYKPDLAEAPGPGWVRTAERTADAQGVVAVWFNPESGERAYVRERQDTRKNLLF
jgi:hypothetical protein